MIKRIALLMLVTLTGAFVVNAVPTVTDVVAKQRYPWNGLVDITCEVSGIDTAVDKRKFVVSAVMPDTGVVVGLKNFWVLENGVKSTNYEVSANGDYCLLWDAKVDLGEVRHNNMVVRITLDVVREKVQLWEGGPYWATTNVGAEKPEDYGYYFWWGDTIGYKWEDNKWVASDGSNSNFSFSEGNTSTYGKNSSTLESEGWITADGALAPEHDAAKKHWGGDWRMPTKQEFSDLLVKCEWTWTTMNGVKGCVVKGRGVYASNSIFLPCAGLGNGTSLSRAGSYGYYWSSVPYSDDSLAWFLYFNSGGNYASNSQSDYHYHYRYYGQSVRPLQGFTK